MQLSTPRLLSIARSYSSLRSFPIPPGVPLETNQFALWCFLCFWTEEETTAFLLQRAAIRLESILSTLWDCLQIYSSQMIDNPFLPPTQDPQPTLFRFSTELSTFPFPQNNSNLPRIPSLICSLGLLSLKSPHPSFIAPQINHWFLSLWQLPH